MKKHLLIASCLLGFLVPALQASPRANTELSATQSREKSQILAHFVENLVLPQYRALESESRELAAAVARFSQERTEASLDAARAAWRSSRTPWEESEAFLFGPVDSLGYDPALDSWPLDLAAFSAALPALTAQDQLNMFEVDPALKGFHAMEYLLFGLNNDKVLASFTEAEYRYLEALATHQLDIAALLLQSWTEGVDGGPAFAETFKSAGAPENDAYPSEAAALQELLEGMVGIADELAMTKLGEPLASGDPNLVESRFSHNSLEDFLSNVQGIRMVYTGGLSQDLAENSLGALVLARDPALHQKIVEALAEAQAALEKVPQPFVNAIQDADGGGKERVAAAKAAAAALFDILDQDLRALF